ncbi:tetratricopeptide repeat protein [Akkermansiaceae bacterium]|nr:tetratricopeptide repeat protein [Akkermansiaceae bacterium]
MRLVAAILAPTLFLLVVEGIFRIAAYGDPTTFFLPVTGRGDLVTGNPRYTYPYFPKQLVREPDMIRMGRKKAEGTYRIFVMGGSAARGTPDPRFSFGRILELMLQEAYPGRRFEVINTAMVAVNSHVVMRVAKECADYDPDLFVVYMGNNEVVGPFGAGTTFNRQTPGRGMIALSLAAKSSRTGQFVRNAIEGFGEKSLKQAEWLGMEMFLDHRVPATDPRIEKVYSHFAANLNDIVETAQDAGVPMILCTVPVNLSDCAPFASDHSRGLDDSALKEWERLYSEGVSLEQQGRWTEADETYAEAEKIDSQFAELHFRRGRCALAMGDDRRAGASYQKACDLDTLRFRADSEINRIIREAGDADSVILLDAEKRFKSLPQVKHGLPGDKLFYEHVHLTFEGDYELAGMVFHETVRQIEGSPIHAIPTQKHCAELLGLTGWDRLEMDTDMMGMVVRPPFLGQLDYYERCSKIHARIRSLREYQTDEGMLRAQQALTAALRKRPDDLHGRMALARLQLQQKNASEAEATIRGLMRDLPGRADFHALLGQALLAQKRKAEADKAFDRCLELTTVPLDYMVLIAEHYERAGEKEQALKLFRQALEAQPGVASRHSKLGQLFVRRGEWVQALREFELADSLLPGNGTILFNLGRIHFENGDIKAAVGKLRDTLKANPFHLGARKQLGLILKKQGHFEEAENQLSMVVAQEPDEVDLRLHRAEARIALGRFDEAESDYRQALEISPNELNAALGLAWVLAVRPETTEGKRKEAVELARRVVQDTGRSSTGPLDVLAAALAATGNYEEAEICADEAWGLALLTKDQELAAAILDRLALYRNRKPYLLPESESK